MNIQIEYIDWETIKLAIICLFMVYCCYVVLFTKRFDNIDPKDKRNGANGL